MSELKSAMILAALLGIGIAALIVTSDEGPIRPAVAAPSVRP